MRIRTNVRRAGVAGAVAALALTVAVVTRGPRMPEAGLDQPAGELAEAGAGGHHEGIKVHGHWAIEVRNPDGSVSEKREFENALGSNGASFLARLLGREEGSGFRWWVRLTSSNPPCEGSTGLIGGCLIEEPGDPQPAGYYIFANLAVEVSGGELVLSGNAVAQRDGTVSSVSTQIVYSLGGSGPFTGTSIAPINVLAGQSILVTVTISFS